MSGVISIEKTVFIAVITTRIHRITFTPTPTALIIAMLARSFVVVRCCM